MRFELIGVRQPLNGWRKYEGPVRIPPIYPWTGHFPGATGAMKRLAFHEEAVECRQMALKYLSRPEAPFLLRVAREFDRLQREKRGSVEDRGQSDGD